MEKLDFSFCSPYDALLEAHSDDMEFNCSIDERWNKGIKFHIFLTKGRGNYFEFDFPTLYECLDFCNEEYNKWLNK